MLVAGFTSPGTEPWPVITSKIMALRLWVPATSYRYEELTLLVSLLGNLASGHENITNLYHHESMHDTLPSE